MNKEALSRRADGSIPTGRAYGSPWQVDHLGERVAGPPPWPLLLAPLFIFLVSAVGMFGVWFWGWRV